MNESVIDFPQQDLCPEIWTKIKNNNDTKTTYQLLSEVEAKILKIYNKLQRDTDTTFSGARITGSITSNSYTENADIDLHILINSLNHIKNDQNKIDFYNKLIKDNYKKVYIGQHPIEVYYQPNEFQDLMSIGCYDVLNKQWLVGPELIDSEFNPYSEYYKDIQKVSDKIVEDVRNSIFSIYEQAVVLKKNIHDDAFLNDNYKQFIDKLKQASVIFNNVREMRKVYSSPISKEQALKYRSSRKWKIADASFKLFDKYGYIAILRAFTEVYNQIEDDKTNINESLIDTILSTVKEYINNEEKLAETDMNEITQLDEGIKEVATSFALSLALLIPGLVSADTIRLAKNKSGITTQQIYSKENIFKSMLDNQDPNEMFGTVKFWQASNILALTLFGEGRSEISNGGFDLICDSILNRTATNTPDLKRVANICIGRKAGRAYQYSFWNKNGAALNIILKQNNAVVPTSITNIVEKRAWETCIDRSIEILTNNYTVTNKKINSYYVTKMKDPPNWANKLTEIEVVGKHTFGYLRSNDPQYTDMATMIAVNKKIKNNTPAKSISNDNKLIANTPKYVIVKSGDTLSKIAKNNNTTVDNIMALNKKIRNKNNISIGQKILVGYASTPKYVIVKSGDTLSKIAKNNNTTVDNIMALNKKIRNKNNISINQKIRVS